MVLSIQMRIIYNIKQRYAICLKFADKFLAFLTKLVLEKENQYMLYNKRKSTFML